MKGELLTAAGATFAAGIFLVAQASPAEHDYVPSVAVSTADAGGATSGIGDAEALTITAAPKAPALAPAVTAINLTMLPNSLPAAVAAQEARSITVHLTTDPNHGWIGSGVEISQNEYLTAGHMIKNPDGTPIPTASVCGDLTIQVPSEHSTGSRPKANGVQEQLFGASANIDRQYGSAIDEDDSATPDEALLQTASPLNYEKPFPQLQYAGDENATPQVGSILFSINYEPPAEGTEYRTPDEEFLSDAGLKQGLSRPAIFGSFVVGTESNGYIVTVNGLKGYGPDGDATGREGESGGPVYDSEGRLVGTSIRGRDLTLAELAQEQGVELDGLSQDTELSETIIQPITSETIQQLELGQAAQPDDCPTVPLSH